MGTANFGIAGLDWQQRVNWEPLIGLRPTSKNPPPFEASNWHPRRSATMVSARLNSA